MEKMTWERWASILFCLFGAGVIAFLLWKYLLPVVLPFLAAWLISLLIRPLSQRLARRLGLPQKLCAAVLLTLFLAGIILLMCFALRRLLGELSQLLGRLMENEGQIPLVNDSFDLFEFLMARLGIEPESGSRYALFREKFYDMVTDMTSHLMETLGEALPSFAARLISSFPSLFFMILITVIAGFYFCMDGTRIGEGLIALLPRSVRARIPEWKARTKQISWRYVKVYLLLLLLTFGELRVPGCLQHRSSCCAVQNRTISKRRKQTKCSGSYVCVRPAYRHKSSDRWSNSSNRSDQHLSESALLFPGKSQHCSHTGRYLRCGRTYRSTSSGDSRICRRSL